MSYDKNLQETLLDGFVNKMGQGQVENVTKLPSDVTKITKRELHQSCMNVCYGFLKEEELSQGQVNLLSILMPYTDALG
jgi:hypothetical protein